MLLRLLPIMLKIMQHNSQMPTYTAPHPRDCAPWAQYCISHTALPDSHAISIIIQYTQTVTISFPGRFLLPQQTLEVASPSQGQLHTIPTQMGQVSYTIVRADVTTVQRSLVL